MTNDQKQAVQAAQEQLRELDQLLLVNFPVGGHANVEKAMELAKGIRKELTKLEGK